MVRFQVLVPLGFAWWYWQRAVKLGREGWQFREVLHFVLLTAKNSLEKGPGLQEECAIKKSGSALHENRAWVASLSLVFKTSYVLKIVCNIEESQFSTRVWYSHNPSSLTFTTTWITLHLHSLSHIRGFLGTWLLRKICKSHEHWRCYFHRHCMMFCLIIA